MFKRKRNNTTVISLQPELINSLLKNGNVNNNSIYRDLVNELNSILSDIYIGSNKEVRFISFIPGLSLLIEPPYSPIWWERAYQKEVIDTIVEMANKRTKSFLDSPNKNFVSAIKYGYHRVAVWFSQAIIVDKLIEDSSYNCIFVSTSITDREKGFSFKLAKVIFVIGYPLKKIFLSSRIDSLVITSILKNSYKFYLELRKISLFFNKIFKKYVVRLKKKIKILIIQIYKQAIVNQILKITKKFIWRCIYSNQDSVKSSTFPQNKNKRKLKFFKKYKGKKFDEYILNSSKIRKITKQSKNNKANVCVQASSPVNVENDPCFYIGVNDSSNGINLKSAIGVINKFAELKIPFCVITESIFVYSKLTFEQIPVKLIKHTNINRVNIKDIVLNVFYGLLSLKALVTKENLNVIKYFLNLSNYLLGVFISKTRAYQQITDIFQTNIPLGFLSIVEGSSLDCAVGELVKKIGVPWVSWTHLLISDNPKYQFFSAEHHVVYGSHGANIIGKYAPKKNIFIAGSPQYDLAYNRDSDQDLYDCQKFFPKWNGQSLIVIGAQNFQNNENEIISIVKELILLDNVYIVIKLHPSNENINLQKQVLNIDPSNQKIAIIKEIDLHVLLNSASLLLASFSNIVINATILKTPTLIYDFGNYERAVDFVKEGICSRVYKISDLNFRVKAILESEKPSFENDYEMEVNMKKFVGFNDGKSIDHTIEYLLNRTNLGLWL
jgi:hypothetical protein